MASLEQSNICTRACTIGRPWYCRLKSEHIRQSGSRRQRYAPRQLTLGSLLEGEDAGNLVTAAFGANPPLKVIHTVKMGKGLAARRATKVGEEIARDRSVVTYSTVRPSQCTAASPQAGPDARSIFGNTTDADAAALVLASLMVHHGPVQLDKAAATQDPMCRRRMLWKLLANRSPGPRHWLALSGPRAKLQARAAVVLKLLSNIGIATCTENQVLEADLQRIGMSAGSSGLLPVSMMGPVERSLGSAAVVAVTLGCALLNHSCAPNAELRWDNGEVVLIALQDIEVGEEVLVSYVNEMDNVLSRRYFLLEQYGFRCACTRCQANFNGYGDTVFGGWRCLQCGDDSGLSSEMLRCSKCNAIIDVNSRQRREKADLVARQKVADALRLVEHKPDVAARCIAEGVTELARVRPPGEPQLVRSLAWKAMLLSKLKHKPGAQVAVSELQEQRRQQRRAVLDEQNHDVISEPEHQIAGDAWQQRLVRALQVYELSEGAVHKGIKRRLGRAEDGGYVVFLNSGQTVCDVAWSYGVDTDISFERQLALHAVVHLFDHTVSSLPSQHSNFVFHREALSDKELTGVAGTLNSHFKLLNAATDQRLLLKMDVEGAEYSAFLSADDGVLSRVDQICLELHWLLRPDRGGSIELKARALERLQKHFVLLHAHGNNYGDIGHLAGCELPDVLEVLYVSRRLLGNTDIQPNSRPIPDADLDAANCAFLPDIELCGAPFRLVSH